MTIAAIYKPAQLAQGKPVQMAAHATREQQVPGEIADLVHQLKCRKTAMTSAEVCRLLSISKTKLCEMTQTVQIPHYRIGGSIRFDPVQMATWLRRQAIGMVA